MNAKNKRIFSVSEINKYIHRMFDQDYLLKSVTVGGEISNCKFDQRGHLYFSLKDEEGALSAVMYRFKQTKGLKCSLHNGMKCVVTGSISVYERSGAYQLYAEEIEEKGLGNLFEQFEALKKRLGDEGLFDQSHKKPIPKYAKRIGIVTASTGAVIHDIINVSRRRNPFVQLILCPAKVQGDGAAEDIAQGIAILDSLGVDCIIVGRGGGSMEDLWAFNEEIVVRAVYNCDTPVISAVGHETDTTLCDYAADLRAPTPSAAAEQAVFDLKAVLDILNEYQMRLSQRMGEILNNKRYMLSSYESRLSLLHPKHQLLLKRDRLSRNYEILVRNFKDLLGSKRQRLILLTSRLEGLSPTKRLTGGYVYAVTDGNKPLVSVEQVSLDDTISVRVADGNIKAKVLKINKLE